MWQVNSQLILDTMEMVNERFDYINKKFPQLVDEANINRLVFIKYYFEDIGKTNRKEMMKEKEQKEAAQSEEREAYSHEEQEVII